MESSPQKQSRRVLELQFVKELEAMRDALTRLSLKMNDLSFLVDAPQRNAAQELAADCIIRWQSRGH